MGSGNLMISIVLLLQAGLLGMTPFDPMGMNSDEMAVKEVKNGRLAMIAFIGFCSQAAVQVRCLPQPLSCCLSKF